MLTTTGLAASILHLFNHALIKATLFLVLACVFYQIKSTKIEDMAGLGKSMPYSIISQFQKEILKVMPLLGLSSCGTM